MHVKQRPTHLPHSRSRRWHHIIHEYVKSPCPGSRVCSVLVGTSILQEHVFHSGIPVWHHPSCDMVLAGSFVEGRLCGVPPSVDFYESGSDSTCELRVSSNRPVSSTTSSPPSCFSYKAEPTFLFA